MIKRSRCRLFLQPSRRKKSPLKLLSRDFRACHSVVLATWPNSHWLRYAITICILSYSLRWEWRNVALGSSWCFKENRRKKLSSGSELEKKTTRQDLANRHGAPQSHLFNQGEKNTLKPEAKSPSKTQSVRGGLALGQACANKLYSLKNEHMVKLL